MSASAYKGGAGIHLQSLILDNSTTAEQKADCVSCQLPVAMMVIHDFEVPRYA